MAERDDEVRRLFLLAAPIAPHESALRSVKTLAADPGIIEAAAALACRVSQEPLFLDFLSRRFPEAPLSLESRRNLEGQAMYHKFRWHEIRDCTEAALDALAESGVRPILLKGISHVVECYSEPRLRPMRDVDLLIREEELDPARRALETGGFEHDEEHHPEARYAGHHHIPPLFHGPTGICVEVHHHLMRLPGYFEGFPPLDVFWKSPWESRLFPGRAAVLEPTLQVLNTCIHITHGDTIGRRAQNLIDLVRTVEVHGESIDWDRLLGLAAKRDVARSLTLPLVYLAGEGLENAPSDVLRRLRSLSRLKRWEIRLLEALVKRYRIGAPPPWKLVSGRLSNILWRQALRPGPTLARAAGALGEALRGR